MPVSVGFPPDRAPIPPGWREAVPGLEAVAGLDGPALLDGLRRGRFEAAVVGSGIAFEPGGLGQGLAVGAVATRMEPRDLVIPAEGSPTLGTLPDRSRVALNGRRRRALLALHRPDLEAVELPPDPAATLEPFLRGGGADAAVVGSHEARAAGISDDASEVLEAKAWMPAPGQGAAVLVIRMEDRDTHATLAPLHHPPTAAALEAEQALARALGMGPGSALGALALPYGRWLRLWAMLPADRGRRVVRADLSGSDRTPRELGLTVARLLLARGADLLPGEHAAGGGGRAG